MRELRTRIDSQEFNEWLAFLSIEPDSGTRMDWLASRLAQHIERVECAMGGKPLGLSGKLIEWDKDEKQDELALIAALESMTHGKPTTRN